jgi:hypothetical protein
LNQEALFFNLAASKLAEEFQSPPASGFFAAQLTYMCRVESNIVGDGPSETRGQSEAGVFNLLRNMELIIRQIVQK